MKTRDQKLVSGFLSDGFDFKGVHYRPLTARSLLFLEKVASPFYNGGGDPLRGLLDFLYVSSNDTRTILEAVRNWDETILDFADGFSPDDLSQLGDIVNESNDEAGAAIVEIAGDEKKS